MSNYERFAAEAKWGDPAALRGALDFGWAAIASGTLNQGDLRKHLEACEAATPDTNDFALPSVSGALDAAVAVCSTLDTLADGEAEHAADAATVARDTVYAATENRLGLSPSDPLLDAKIQESTQMRRELALQEQAMRILENSTELRPEVVASLRVLSS